MDPRYLIAAVTFVVALGGWYVIGRAIHGESWAALDRRAAEDERRRLEGDEPADDAARGTDGDGA